MFRLGTGQVVRTIRAEKGPMSCMDVHPDGLMVATGGETDGSIHVWEILGRKLAASLRDHTGHVSCLAFSEVFFFVRLLRMLTNVSAFVEWRQIGQRFVAVRRIF